MKLTLIGPLSFLLCASISYAESYRDLSIIPVSVGEEILVYQSCYDCYSVAPKKVLYSSVKQNGYVEYFIGDSASSGNIESLDKKTSYVKRPNTCLESSINKNEICVGDEVLVDWVVGVGGTTTGKVIGIGRTPQKAWPLFSKKAHNQILIQVHQDNGFEFKTYNEIDSVSRINPKSE